LAKKRKRKGAVVWAQRHPLRQKCRHKYGAKS